MNINEVVKHHIEKGNMDNLEQMKNNIIENVIELAEREIAEQLDLKCKYSYYTCRCLLCGDCECSVDKIKENELRDINEASAKNEYYNSI